MTGLQLHSAVLPVSLEHTYYAEQLGEKIGEKKADCDSDPCFLSESPPDPSCGVN